MAEICFDDPTLLEPGSMQMRTTGRLALGLVMALALTQCDGEEGDETPAPAEARDPTPEPTSEPTPYKKLQKKTAGPGPAVSSY